MFSKSHSYKGHIHLINSLNIMNRSFKKWKLIIIGEGEDKYKSKLADLIKSLIYKEKFFSQEFRFILRDF